ncbi:MAG: hypothetical protein ACK5Z4_07025 [Planctomyces sp.]
MTHPPHTRAQTLIDPAARSRVTHRHAALWAAMLAACSAVAACAPTAGTTRLGGADIAIDGPRLRQTLADAPYFADRPIRPRTPSPTADEMVIVARELENRSNDRLSASDRWAPVALLINDSGVRAFLNDRGVRVMLPPEDVAQVRALGIDVPEAPSMAPTHTLTGVVRTITRQAALVSSVADARKDVTLVEWTLTDVRTREVVWSGRTEFARVARGVVAD